MNQVTETVLNQLGASGLFSLVGKEILDNPGEHYASKQIVYNKTEIYELERNPEPLDTREKYAAAKRGEPSENEKRIAKLKAENTEMSVNSRKNYEQEVKETYVTFSKEVKEALKGVNQKSVDKKEFYNGIAAGIANGMAIMATGKRLNKEYLKEIADGADISNILKDEREFLSAMVSLGSQIAYFVPDSMASLFSASKLSMKWGAEQVTQGKADEAADVPTETPTA